MELLSLWFKSAVMTRYLTIDLVVAVLVVWLAALSLATAVNV
jgi:hypothetical protein